MELEASLRRQARDKYLLPRDMPVNSSTVRGVPGDQRKGTEIRKGAGVCQLSRGGAAFRTERREQLV